MNSENSKTSDPHRLLLNLLDKINLKRSDMLLYQSLVFIINGINMKKSCKNYKFKISARPWNEEFELHDGSYSVSNIQDCFKWILKKHETVNDNPSIIIYVNKIENRITFKIKTGYYRERLTPETMKLLRSTKRKITKDKSGENVSHLEIIEVVLVPCNIVNNDYQQDSRVLYTFVPNKSSG